jgi:dihydroxyacetone kinase-like protein
MEMTPELLVSSLRRICQVLRDNKQYLIDLDSPIGDADHGVNMDRGFTAVLAKLDTMDGQDAAAILKMVATTLISTVGGASGPLYGTGFLRAGTALAGKQSLTLDDTVTAMNAAVEGIIARGKATTGEKTMLDVLIPVSRLLSRLAAEDAVLPALCDQLKDEARRNMLATKDMIATKGRAHFLGERALGHIDPGCKTCEVAIGAVCDTVTQAKETA